MSVALTILRYPQQYPPKNNTLSNSTLPVFLLRSIKVSAERFCPDDLSIKGRGYATLKKFEFNVM